MSNFGCVATNGYFVLEVGRKKSTNQPTMNWMLHITGHQKIPGVFHINGCFSIFFEKQNEYHRNTTKMPITWCFFLSKEGVSEILQHHHHLAVLPTWISTSRRCPWTLVLSPAAAFPQVIGVLGLPWHHKTKAEPVVVEVNSGSCRMPVMQSPSCKKSKLETQLGWKFPFVVKENVQKKGG